MPPKLMATPCIHCRQMKLRCDAQSRFPSPCSRCSKFHLRCSIDPSFKRTAKRDRLQKVEKELHEIKRKLEQSSRYEKKDGGHNHRSSTPSAESHDAIDVQNPLTSTDVMLSLQNAAATVVPMSLNGLTIDSPTICCLLRDYYTFYHSQFPIAPELSEFLKSYPSQPLLFWSMAIIASKTSAQYPSLYLEVSNFIPALVEQVIHSGDKRVWMVQALLLLCCWPLPFGPKAADPSLTYSGLAIHIALQIGVHRHRFPADFVYGATYEDDEGFLQNKVWLACFIVNQNVCAELGVPATFPMDRTIIDVLETLDSRIPTVLTHQLQSAYMSYKISQSLGYNVLSLSGLLRDRTSLIHLFEIDLASFEARDGMNWSTPSELLFLSADLQLSNFAFEYQDKEDRKDDTPSELGNSTESLTRAYTKAMKLVQLATSKPLESPYWTHQVHQTVTYALLFLLKLRRCSQLDFVDSPSTKNAISQGWNFLRNASLLENDHASRRSAIIEYLSKLNEKQPGSPAVSVQSRMAANVVYDSVWTAKQRFSRRVRDLRPADYTSTAALEKLDTPWEYDLLDETSFDRILTEWDSMLDGF